MGFEYDLRLCGGEKWGVNQIAVYDAAVNNYGTRPLYVSSVGTWGELQERNMTASTLGRFVLDTARGTQKTSFMPQDQAKEVRDQLAERVSEKVEAIRALERRAHDSAKLVTVF